MGELGSDLVDLFKPPIVAEFEFRKEGKFRHTPVSVYEFHIAADKNTFWALRDDTGVTLYPEYEGELRLDSQKGQLLRLKLRPLRLPSDFGFAIADITIDDREIHIADLGTFLLPYKSEATACVRAPGQVPAHCTKNVLAFHHCRKFAAKALIRTDNPQ